MDEYPTYPQPKKPYPWKRIDDYNPDHLESFGRQWTEDMGTDTYCVMEVAWLGAVIFTVRNGELHMAAVSDGEIKCGSLDTSLREY